MRMSCNGCRVLRKGCGQGCTIRPCLQWIRSPEAQANATVFLAKFYGRAGLINLINAAPPHLRPAIFRSLLYEACGRIINPVYGSVGLLWSGSWRICQAAVQSVLLRGDPSAGAHFPPANAAAPKPYDSRHVAKTNTSMDLHKVAANSRVRFKRSGAAHLVQLQQEISNEEEDEVEEEREKSAEMADGSSVLSRGEPAEEGGTDVEGSGDTYLRLSLGYESASAKRGPAVLKVDTACSAEGCPVDLGLSLC